MSYSMERRDLNLTKENCLEKYECGLLASSKSSCRGSEDTEGGA